MSNVIIFAGSNGKNLELAQMFEKELQKHKVSSQLVDLVSLDLPLYTPAEEARGIPAKILDEIGVYDSAKGFVFVTPEYNGGVPPAVSNVIAWISRSGDADWRRVFNGKPAALASFSGSGGIQALLALRSQLAYLGLNVVGRQARATPQVELNMEDVEAVAGLLAKSL